MSASQPAPTARRSSRHVAVKSYREPDEHIDDESAFDDSDVADVENSYHPNRPTKRRKPTKPAKSARAATQPAEDEWREEDELGEQGGGEGRHYTDEQLMDDSDIRLEAGDRDEESDAGVVLKVELVNFMVHQHFTATLNKHITFIHGPNGSGRPRTPHTSHCIHRPLASTDCECVLCV